MKRRSKSKSAVPRVDPYLEGLMAKLLDRLVGLERKMDVVVAQTAARASGGGDSSKPAQSPEAKQAQRRDRILYEAICAECHKVCEVPFRPTEERPVYCKECWARRKAGHSGRPGMPVLTPVALSPKPVSKMHLPTPAASAVRQTPKKAKAKVKQASKKAKKKSR